MKQNLLNSLRLRLCMLVALFCTLSTSVWGQTWQKVTSAPSDWSGEYLIVYEKTSTSAYVWTGVDAASCYATATISSGTISSKPDGAASVTIASMTGGYSIKVNGGTNNGKYIKGTSGSNALGFNPSEQLNTISYSSNAVDIVSNTSHLRFNSDSNNLRFRFFKSSSYSNQKTIQLYKKVEATPTHTLTYSATNGTIAGVNASSAAVSSGASVAEGATVTLTATPDAGYKFDSWSVTGTGSTLSSTSTNPTTFTMGTANATVTANFTAAGSTTTYSVTYNANGATSGDVPTDANEYEADDEVTVLGNTGGLAKTGNAFGGWCMNAECTGTVYGPNNTTTFNVTGNTTLYAKWTPYTITAQSNNISYGTVSLSGSVITGSPKSGYRYATPAYTVSPANSATVAQNGNEFTVTPSANTTVTINFEAIPTHTATFSVNGTTSTQTVAEGAAIIFPSDPAAISGKSFVGWLKNSTITGTTNEAPSTVDKSNESMSNSDVTYYAVFATVSGSVVTDELTTSTFGSPSSYGDWSGKQATNGSSAVYAGNSTTYTQNSSNAIQIRASGSTQDPSGIVTTATGGKATKVTVSWNSGTADERTLDVYGKTSAYTDASDLYNNTNKGTLLGSLYHGVTINNVKTTTTELTINGNYTYIGLRSNSGAMYLDEIDIEWSNVTYSNYCTTVETPTVATPTFSPAAGSVASGTTVTIACATDGATIYYTTDDTEPTNESSVYSNPISITIATTLKAIAVKEGYNDSEVATAGYTIANPVATPTFSPAAGSVASGTTVTITCATDGATIYYTTDDSAPTTSSTEYDSENKPTVTAATTIKAIAVKDGMANSAVAEAAYTIIYTVTLSDDTENPMTEYSAGVGVTLPTRSTIGGYTFAGWSETNVSEETTTAPTIIPAGTYYPTSNMTLYPVYTKTVGGGGTSHETASVTISEYATANSWANSTKYTSVTLDENVTASTYDKTGTGNTGKYYSSDITWRFYQNEDAKVTISTTSGELTSVTFTFTVSNTGTLNYNSSPITSETAVNVSGTSAEFTVGNSSTATNGQVKITAISVNYDVTGGSTTYYWSAPVAAAVETPEIAIAENPFLFSTTATITCATEGAAIKYSYDGENWNDYSSALTITETTTIYAKAIKNTDESSVAQVTATKNLATPTVTVSGDLTLDLDGETNVSAGTLSAAVTYNEAAVAGATVTWSSNNTDIATIDASGAVTIKTTGEVTFTATYAGNSDYAEATGTKTVTVVDSKAPGSEGNPYTVTQALSVIDALEDNGTLDNKYVSGKISQIDSYNSTYHSITYWISADGTTSNQLQVYSGKGLDGANFSAITDLEVGDAVVVKGQLKKYVKNSTTTPEFNQNSQLVSHTTKTASNLTKTNDISLSMANPSVTATATDYFTTSSEGALSYEIADDAVATVSAAGVVTPVAAGTTTLTVSQAADATYKAGSLEITVIVAAASFNSTTIAANASGSTTYGTNKVENYMIDDTYDGTVAAVSSNPAVATVAITQHTAGDGTFTITPVAVGTAVITISAPATATCEAAEDVTYTITVNAPAGQTTAVAAPTTLFNETFASSTGSNDGFGSSGTTSDGNGDFIADNDWSSLENEHGANGAAKFGTSNKSGYARTSDLTVTVGTTYTLTFKAAPWGSESTTMTVNVDGGTINSAATVVSSEMTTGKWNEFSYEIVATATTMSIGFSASNKRFFLDEVKVINGVEITAKLNSSGYATYCSQYPLDFTDTETNGYSAWQITGISGETITFEQITGKVKGGTGILLKGTASETITLASADSDNELSGNKLVGTLAPTYFVEDAIYGLAGNTFKQNYAGTFKANKAYIPASEISSSVRAFTFVFVDPTTGITETQNVSAEEFGAIFNLAGQRVSQPQRGVNIINGKKTLFVK